MIQRELIPGKLRIVRRIGAGGMGVVYEALHLGLDRRVAVKVIHPQSSESAEARTRFFREARAMALMQSEHIVRVLDVDTLPEGDPYMVMEYLEGRDLKRELIKRGPLPVDEAVGYLIQASTGVAVAHGAGIIHRDIKPANIFITNLEGARRAKLLDFGVAKFSSLPDQCLTGPTAQLGTPLYMPPEQMSGLDADVRSDVWSLGVVLFQLLTGEAPFRAKGNEGTATAIMRGLAPLLHEVRADVPVPLSFIVARCLEKSPTRRFESADALAAALAPFGPREPLVRASHRAPRGSSAPPQAPPNNDLARIVLSSTAPSPSSKQDTLTVARVGLDGPIATVHLERATMPVRASTSGRLSQAARSADSDATAPFRVASPVPEQPQTPAVDAGAREAFPSARRVGLVSRVGGFIALGLLTVLGFTRFASRNNGPISASPRASTSRVALPAPNSLENVAAVREPARDPTASPVTSAPDPPSTLSHAPAANAKRLPRIKLSGAGANAAKTLDAAPAPHSSSSTSIPLHL